MTGNEMLTFVRSLIAEAEAKFWTDAELIMYLNGHFKLYQEIINNSQYGLYLTDTTVTLSANSNYAALPSDCSGKIYNVLDIGNSYRELQFESYNTHNKYSSEKGTPTGMCISGSRIYFNRYTGTERTYMLNYYKFPTEIAANDTEVDFPDIGAMLLCYEAAATARIKDRDNDLTWITQERNRLNGIFMNHIDDRDNGSHVRQHMPWVV